MVRVFAHAATGVRQTFKLLRELNEIQLSARSASIAVAGDVVIVWQTLSPIGLSGPVLRQALTAVGGVADSVGMLVASVFDGQTRTRSSDRSPRTRGDSLIRCARQADRRDPGRILRSLKSDPIGRPHLRINRVPRNAGLLVRATIRPCSP
jgi:hypothetical protein